jgi:hypothetical protein
LWTPVVKAALLAAALSPWCVLVGCRYEAFQQMGWEKTKTCIHDLRRAADDLYAANAEDDLVDDDDDGVA